jgi:flagellar biogenesis protein FliO
MEISLTTPIFRSVLGRLLQICQLKVGQLWSSPRKQRALFIKETAGLGERRFVAVLQFERQRFLIGGSPGSVTLLAHLPEEKGTEIGPE